MNHENEVQLIELPDIKLVGLSVTSPFQGHDPERVEAMKRLFYERRGEIRNAVRPERYVSPSFSSEVLFTYMICMEVDDLTDAPEGMIGFTIPARRYAKAKTKGDPYRVIGDCLRANGLRSDGRALALEIYRFENPAWPDEAEVLVPLQR
ncbi:GyrI-like domain-containing protein [Paenibacillus sp. GYB003]|uniref:GyrI-like domain-containing protein n=1 Tax=Paenibacillus sp. GYB003 TaxID=2994392 RepID=UPI002F962EF1